MRVTKGGLSGIFGYFGEFQVEEMDGVEGRLEGRWEVAGQHVEHPVPAPQSFLHVLL